VGGPASCGTLPQILRLAGRVSAGAAILPGTKMNDKSSPWKISRGCFSGWFSGLRPSWNHLRLAERSGSFDAVEMDRISVLEGVAECAVFHLNVPVLIEDGYSSAAFGQAGDFKQLLLGCSLGGAGEDEQGTVMDLDGTVHRIAVPDGVVEEWGIEHGCEFCQLAVQDRDVSPGLLRAWFPKRWKDRQSPPKLWLK
jgi:hypothetical protein